MPELIIFHQGARGYRKLISVDMTCMRCMTTRHRELLVRCSLCPLYCDNLQRSSIDSSQDMNVRITSLRKT